MIDTTNRAPRPDAPIIVFHNNPTPINAVKLAIADHKSSGAVDWKFVKALETAVEELESLPMWMDNADGG